VRGRGAEKHLESTLFRIDAHFQEFQKINYPDSEPEKVPSGEGNSKFRAFVVRTANRGYPIFARLRYSFVARFLRVENL